MQGSIPVLLSLFISLVIVSGCVNESSQNDQVDSTNVLERPEDTAPVVDPTTVDQPKTLGPADPFFAADYLNAGKVLNLLETLGDEKELPVALTDDAEPIARDAAEQMWTTFLQRTRVVATKNGFIQKVLDYCDNTVTDLYMRRDGGWLNGRNGAWLVRHDDYTEWNKPRLVTRNPTGTTRAAYLRSAYDGMEGGPLTIDVSRKLVLHGAGVDQLELRIFDHPQCEDVVPVNEYSPDRWEILGIGDSKHVLDEIPLDEPQLDEDELLRRWNSILDGVVVFANMQGGEMSGVYCGDGTGFNTNRYAEKHVYGLPFKWRVENGESIAKNAVWLITEYFDPSDPLLSPVSRILVDIEAQTDPYQSVVLAELSDCSADVGHDYLNTVSANRFTE